MTRFFTPEEPKHILRVLAQGQVEDWGIKACRCQDIWLKTRGKGIKVSILDTGVAPHPDLPKIHAYRGSKDFVDAVDKQGHGCHCAGIIVAINNDIGVVGIASDAQLNSFKVMGDDGEGSFEVLAHNIKCATQTGSHIISMSLGSLESPSDAELKALNEAIEYAHSRGVILVAAAGNEYNGTSDTINWPARCDWVIPVAAVDKFDKHPAFSSTGTELKKGVSMPGVDIYSTWLNNSYATLSGTSMATPMLAGFIALMLSYHLTGDHKSPIAPLGNPNRYEDVLSHLVNYVTPLGDDLVFGIGMPDGEKIGVDGD